MVFDTPQIESFTNFCQNIYRNSSKKYYRNLYIIKNNSLYKKFPKRILGYVKNSNYYIDELEIKYLPNNRDCLVIYGNSKFKKSNIKLGSLVSSKLKNDNWKLFSDLNKKEEFNFALGWGLNQYKFNNKKNLSSLKLSKTADTNQLVSVLGGIFYGKELINIPSSDLGPDQLEKTFINFAKHYNLKFKIYKGQIIEKSFPLIYAVGKASKEKPRLLEMDFYKNKNYPQIIIVGKGVCFDTGGLNLKPSQYMRNMKKDMGGAASVLSLANIIINSNLKVNLKVLIPTVDNDIGSGSMRPGDVYNSKAGITVEIGNTDAEGRLILADTLTYADNLKPNLIIDFATLTGAARVALGPDLPAYFTNSDKLASIINLVSIKEEDPLWRMPLWSGYDSWLKSDEADINNISKGSFAGSITAALFLCKFIKKTKNWIHVDTYAWSDKFVPGHSLGGDILGVRSVFKMIEKFIK